MKNLNLKSVIISAIIVWVLGVTAFISSYFVSIMDDPDTQANWVLSIVLIPVVTLGAHIYYRKGYKTNGFLLGAAMFTVAIILDALITVPVLMAPYGVNHAAFFGDIMFWFIGMEYVSVVAAYWQIERVVKAIRLSKA